MTGSLLPIGDDDIQAYVDDRLPPERRALIEAYLAANSDLRNQVAVFRTQRDVLRDRLSAKAREPVPGRLRVADIVARREAHRRRRLTALAAALLLFVAGAGGGWLANDWLASRAQPGVARQAFAAYRAFAVEVAHPVEVGGDNEAHLVQWLSNRLGRKIAAPDLRAQGFHLMGGRLLPADRQLAAQFMYQDGAGARLTLYVSAAEHAETAFRFVEDRGVSGFYWVDRDLGYAVTAQAPRERLLDVARSVYRQVAEPTEARAGTS